MNPFSRFNIGSYQSFPLNEISEIHKKAYEFYQ